MAFEAHVNWPCCWCNTLDVHIVMIDQGSCIHRRERRGTGKARGSRCRSEFPWWAKLPSDRHGSIETSYAKSPRSKWSVGIQVGVRSSDMVIGSGDCAKLDQMRKVHEQGRWETGTCKR
jgi:hypothetical protein